MAHEIDYEISGSGGSQYAVIELDARETVIAEAGAMLFMDEGITFETKMGDGTSKGLMKNLFSAAKRSLARESLFLTHFTNESYQKQHIAVSAPHLGSIIALDLSNHQNQILCQQRSFLAAAFGTTVSMAFTKKLGVGLLGGENFVLTKLEGDGNVFIHAGGSLIERELKGETLRIDTGCIVAMEMAIDYDITKAGNLRSMFFGGEGLFLATLTGYGKVWLQTMPISRIAQSMGAGGGTGAAATGGLLAGGAAAIGASTIFNK